jgi:hypothetical protein
MTQDALIGLLVTNPLIALELVLHLVKNFDARWLDVETSEAVSGRLMQRFLVVCTTAVHLVLVVVPAQLLEQTPKCQVESRVLVFAIAFRANDWPRTNESEFNPIAPDETFATVVTAHRHIKLKSAITVELRNLGDFL